MVRGREAVKAANVSAGGTRSASEPTSFQGMILKNLGNLTQTLLENIKQDTGRGANTSRVLSELFMWKQISSMADSRYEKLMKEAKEDGVLGDVRELVPGQHAIAESRHFFVTATVTEPVKKFSPNMLCAWALKAYDIPEILMKEQIERAKEPTKSQVRITITERA